MPSDSRVHDALLDMQDNILLAQQFVLGLDFDAFSVSRLHFYATTRALEIISEASHRLPDEVRLRRQLSGVGSGHPYAIARKNDLPTVQRPKPVVTVGYATSSLKSSERTRSRL